MVAAVAPWRSSNATRRRELANAYIRLTSLHMLARHRDEAVRWGERAAALATEVGDPTVLGRALTEYGIADVMDSRFDGLARIHRAIELGRHQHLPSIVAGGLVQIGSGCGELRRYDLAVPALVEGTAFAGDHHPSTSASTWCRGSGAAASTSGSGTRRRPTPSMCSAAR